MIENIKPEWPKKISYTVHPEGRIDLGTAAPFDGNPVLIRTKIGWVEAWWEKGYTVVHQEGEEYEGWLWVCYDDRFQCELDEAIEWMPLPPNSEKSKQACDLANSNSKPPSLQLRKP